MKAVIEEALKDIEPMLQASGRKIIVKDVDGGTCVIQLEGFCGDCACGETYKEGIQEIIREKAPQIETIEFILA